MPELSGLTVEPLPPPVGPANFDLSLDFEERDGGLAGVVEYNADLFHRPPWSG